MTVAGSTHHRDSYCKVCRFDVEGAKLESHGSLQEEKEYYTLIDLSFCSITTGEKDDSRVGTEEDH
ncbi:unnamed protein product [Clonostachys chloroleuca]|uniref:Uncharacterized protein n=1 Tax=Clonostachys chloroleuca TaxID=1926264 RepID=A0AA35PTB1_9HYPO|nr:unnamed protein product [Clonostachys chloroleuca]